MKRGTRRLRRVLIACLGLLLAGMLAEAWLLPVLARMRVRRTLEQIDPAAAFELRSVCPGRIDLTRVGLGNPAWLSADGRALRAPNPPHGQPCSRCRSSQGRLQET